MVAVDFVWGRWFVWIAAIESPILFGGGVKFLLKTLLFNFSDVIFAHV